MFLGCFGDVLGGIITGSLALLLSGLLLLCDHLLADVLVRRTLDLLLLGTIFLLLDGLLPGNLTFFHFFKK